jgi:hypothetical protein
MVLTQIEKQFQKYIPDWIQNFYINDYVFTKLPIKNKIKAFFYNTCLVADVRRKLGLTTFYYLDIPYLFSYCYECIDFGFDIMECYNKDRYIDILTKLKNHLEYDHNIKI